MNVAVLIPTVGGRDSLLERVEREFYRLGAGRVLIKWGCSWGEGCNQLARIAGDRYRYLLLACDDTLPHEGWFEAARPVVDADRTPVSRYLTPDGGPLRPGTDDAPAGTALPWSRSFLITPAIFAEVGPLIDTTWYADFNYSERLAEAGRPLLAVDGFTFTHLESSRDWLTPAEDNRQRQVYEAATEARRAAGGVL